MVVNNTKWIIQLALCTVHDLRQGFPIAVTAFSRTEFLSMTEFLFRNHFYAILTIIIRHFHQYHHYKKAERICLSPLFGSGTPITKASETAGCESNTFSTSETNDYMAGQLNGITKRTWLVLKLHFFKHNINPLKF